MLGQRKIHMTNLTFDFTKHDIDYHITLTIITVKLLNINFKESLALVKYVMRITMY